METNEIPKRAAFERGDVVTLKSGGLKMTVYSYSHSYVVCNWFDDQGNWKER